MGNPSRQPWAEQGYNRTLAPLLLFINDQNSSKITDNDSIEKTKHTDFEKGLQKHLIKKKKSGGPKL